MKNLCRLFLSISSLLLASNSLLAQQIVIPNALIGVSLNQEEMGKVSIERVVETWKDNYPDSVICLGNLQGGQLRLLAFRDGEAAAEPLLLSRSKEYLLLRSMDRATLSMQEPFEEIESLLLEASHVEIVADFHTGDNFFIKVTHVVEGQLIGTSRGNLVSVGWWELDHVRIQQGVSKGRDLYNPNATRYFLGPSAIPLKKGEGYYQNVMVGFNSVNYGITDHISVTAGTEMFTLAAGMFNGGIVNGFANLKVGAEVADKLYIGGGILTGGFFHLGEKTGDGASLGYGIVTYGTERTNMSFSAALGRVNKRWAENPVFVLSGMHQINNKIGVVTESWILKRSQDFYSTTTLAMSGGIRLLANNVSVDLGMIAIGNKNSFEDPALESYQGFDMVPFPLPFLGIVYKFQK